MRFCLNYHAGEKSLKKCEYAQFQNGPMCRGCGCHLCGGIILADTEDWPHPLCAECYEDIKERLKP